MPTLWVKQPHPHVYHHVKINNALFLYATLLVKQPYPHVYHHVKINNALSLYAALLLKQPYPQPLSTCLPQLPVSRNVTPGRSNILD